MKNAELIGSLIPSHPDFQPVIQEIREKEQLPEVGHNEVSFSKT